MAYPGFSVTNTFSAGTDALASEVNTNFTQTETVVNGASAVGTPAAIAMTPIGAMVGWLKTLHEKSSTGSQTNTSTSATQLIDTNADFVSDGITAGMIVHNEDDDEYAIVETVVDLNTLTLVSDLNAGTADVDTFNSATGVNYAIYSTPELPDNWLECNGQTISDADSPMNGAILPDMNSGAQRFLRGATGSGGTGGSESHTHTITSDTNTGNVLNSGGSAAPWKDHNHGGATGSYSTLPTYYESVWIVRIK